MSMDMFGGGGGASSSGISLPWSDLYSTPTKPWEKTDAANSEHKQVKQMSAKVNFLKTILAGDRSDPINPMSSSNQKTILGG